MLLASIFTVSGQSGNVVNFSNRDITHGLNAPFYDSDGTTRLSGANFRAALYYGPSDAPEQMVQVGLPQPFLTGSSAGYWQPANRTIVGGPAPGQPIYVQVKFWDSQGGQYPFFEQAYASHAKVGFSEVLQLTPQPFGQTMWLQGLKSASLIGVSTNLTLGETRSVVDVMNVQNGLQFGTLCSEPVGRMRWFHLLFANPGDAVVRSEGSSIDTVLSVFTSCLLSSNGCAPVVCNGGQVRFQVQTNVTYAVAVGGLNGATGTLHLTFSMPVELTAERTSDQKVDISWPAAATEFSLEVNTNMAMPDWHPVEDTPYVSNNRNWLRLSCDGHGRFYRLKRNAP